MQDDLLTAAQNGTLYEGKDAILWAAWTGQKIGDKDAILWAIENGKTIGGKDPIVWAVTNGKTIDGQKPIEWAIENNKKIDGHDPIQWAVEMQVFLYGKNPIEWVIESGKKIGEYDPIFWAVETGELLYGKDAMLWAVENGKEIEGQKPIEWAVTNNKRINHRNPIVWAVENDKKVYGLDPIAWAIENKKTIEDKDPILWAVETGKKIDGKDPIVWAEDNNHSVDKEVLKKHLDKKLRNQNISVQAPNSQDPAFNEIVYAERKEHGVSTGGIYKTNDGAESLMVKPARKDLFDTEHRDVNAEYMLGSLYKRLLYNQAPDIQLMVQPTEMGNNKGIKSLKQDPKQQTIAVTSRFFKDDFQMLDDVTQRDNLAAWEQIKGSFQEDELQIISIEDKQALATAINTILEDELTSKIDTDNHIFDEELIDDAIHSKFKVGKGALGIFLGTLKQEMGDSYPLILHQSQIKGFEKVIAACVILGEVDYHGGNLGVINQGTDDNPDYLAVKIDHGRSGLNTFTDEALLRADLAERFKKHNYNQMPFSALAFKNAIDEMVKISEEELRTHLGRREATLAKLGFSVNISVLSIVVEDGVDINDTGVNATDVYTARILQNIKIVKELSKTLDIFLKTNAPSAIKNGGWLQSLGMVDPIVWACDNKYTIEGKDPLIWAVENGRKVEEREAVYSIKDKTPASNWVDEQFQNVDLETISNDEFQTLCNMIDACPNAELKTGICKKAIIDGVKIYDTPALLYFEQKNIKLRDWANAELSEAVKKQDHQCISNLLNAGGVEPTEECLNFIIENKSNKLFNAMTIDGLNINDWANARLSDIKQTTPMSKYLTEKACTLLTLLGENVKNEFINNFVDLAEIHKLQIDSMNPKEWRNQILLLKEPDKKPADLVNAARLHEPYVSSHNVGKGGF